MTPQKQLFLHDPANGLYGDCYRTCIAMLLDLPAAEVPHFNDGTVDDIEAQDKRARGWLSERGLTLISVPFSGEELSFRDLCHRMREAGGDVHFMVTGATERGTCHVIIADKGGLVFDPSPLSDQGLSGPVEGHWWVTWIGKIV